MSTRTTKPTKSSPARKTTKSSKRSRGRRPVTRRLAGVRVWTLAGLAAVVLAIGGFLAIGGRGAQGGVVAGSAPAFSLPSTDGSTVSLTDFQGTNVLLYFSEGVGCDACFYQMVNIEKNAAAFASAGITVVPIVANPIPDVISEMNRFGLTIPYLVDADTSVSQAYEMLGKGMHANLPGHGFVLVDTNGRLRWQMEYPSMYVSTANLLRAATQALASPTP